MRKHVIGIVVLCLAAVWLTVSIGCKKPPETDQVPPVFSGLTGAVAASDTAIGLSWSAATDDQSAADEIIYRIYYATASGDQDMGSPNATTPAGATTYEVDALWPKQTYYFVVRAEDEAGRRDANTVERDATTPSYAFSIQENPSTDDSEAAGAVAMDADYLYVAGQDATPGNIQWRIEKRDRGTGDLISAFDGDGVVVSNPSASVDTLTCIAVDADYLYTTGFDYSPGDSQWRIEKRDKITGALIAAFDTDGVVESHPSPQADSPNSIVLDESYLYIAGTVANIQWRIEKRDKVTGALVTAFDTDGVAESTPSGATNNVLSSIAIDGSYLYAAGWDYAPGNDQWRIEKRDKTTGALVTAFDTDGVVVSNPSTSYDRAFSIAADSSCLYVTGFDNSQASSQLRIEKRDKTTGALLTAFDTDGVVESFPTNGAIGRAIAVDGSYLYVAGSDYTLVNGQWRIEKRNKTTGALITAFDMDGVVQSNPSTGFDSANSLVIDNNYLYIVGKDSAPGNGQWRIEKRILHSGGY